MEAFRGLVFRRAPSDMRHGVHEENVAAMKADLAHLKAEDAQAHADRKGKLQEKINQLDSKIQVQLQKAKDKCTVKELEAQTKAKVPAGKAAVAEARVS